MTAEATRNRTDIAREDRARPLEIEPLTNRYIIHPASRAILPFLISARIHPNLVSLTGLISGLGATAIYAGGTGAAGAIGGLACLVGWMILDGADGKLARATGKASAAGHIVDGLADYWVFIALYVALMHSSAPTIGPLAWWLGLLAGLSHVIQAAAYELERERYVRHTSGLQRPEPSAAEKSAETERLSLPIRITAWYYSKVLTLVGRGRTPPVLADLTADEYRTQFAPLIRRLGFLSANSHVLAIFVFVLAGKPWGYFLFESIAMNLLLLILLVQRRRTIKALAVRAP